MVASDNSPQSTLQNCYMCTVSDVEANLHSLGKLNEYTLIFFGQTMIGNTTSLNLEVAYTSRLYIYAAIHLVEYEDQRRSIHLVEYHWKINVRATIFPTSASCRPLRGSHCFRLQSSRCRFLRPLFYPPPPTRCALRKNLYCHRCKSTAFLASSVRRLEMQDENALSRWRVLGLLSARASSLPCSQPIPVQALLRRDLNGRFISLATATREL